MIFSNLAGTTSKSFTIGQKEFDNVWIQPNGPIISNNAYDLFWSRPNPKTNSINPNIRLIQKDSNLNDYISGSHIGQWNATTAITPTIKNLPSKSILEFTLLILPNSCNYDGCIRQELVTRNGEKYERSYYEYGNPSWQPWKQVAYKSDLPLFESGTFAPGPYKGASYSFKTNSSGKYIKFLNKVILMFNLQVSVIKNGDIFAVTGFPFQSSDMANIIGHFAIQGIFTTQICYLIPKTSYSARTVNFECLELLPSSNMSRITSFSHDFILEQGGSRNATILGWCSFLVQ